MCKHILINQFTPNDIETLKAFCQLTYDRDGFGAIIRRNDDSLEYLKSLDLGSFYLDLSQEISKGLKSLVVHHRTSTNKQGIDYAHPFEFEGYLMTHNGVVQVPGNHDTKTSNDSEALLHHLIKSDWKTTEISGYFSCFLMNQHHTIVLVDDCAPMYTDGRVWCSHKLGDKFKKIELKKITLSPDGLIATENKIKVTKSGYGQNMAHLSLGKPYASSYDWPDYSSAATVTDMRDFSVYSDNFDLFLTYLTRAEESQLMREAKRGNLMRALLEKAHDFGIELTADEIVELEEYFR